MLFILVAIEIEIDNINIDIRRIDNAIESINTTIDTPKIPEIPNIPPTSTPIEDNRWWTDKELDMLAAVIYYESNDCTDRHQQLVGQVVINRVNNDNFPDTIYDVITQTEPTIQYSTYKEILSIIETPEIIPQRCYDNALVILNEEVKYPDNIVYQANFEQGSGIFEEIHTSYSISYFCYE